MPKIVDAEQRRAEIAKAAANAIVAHGIDDVTMVAIAKAAGMTTGAVTHYFADKDDVILAALRWADGAMQARTARALDEHDDVAAIILAALPHDEASRTEWLVWCVFYDRATRNPALMAEQRARDTDWQRMAVQVLSDMRGRGELDPSVDIEAEAHLAVALVDGIGFHAASDPASWPEEKQQRLVAQYLARLAPRS
ncbi:MAG: TetR/AcrR family transcriptional regulator [Myxococcota bacterium]